MLASLRSFPRPALSAVDAIVEKGRARDLYERVMKVLDGSPQGALSDQVKTANRALRSIKSLREDVEMHVEISSLWQRENAERASSALLEAIRINSTKTPSVVSTSKLRNNLAVLKHLSAAFSEARACYEEALPATLSEGTAEAETSSVTILYNLARVYEDLAEYNMARDAYVKLLSRHPEYIDGALYCANQS